MANVITNFLPLTGGHTIGNAHCFVFSSRLYNFTGKGDKDPSSDPKYIPFLKKKCKPGDVTTLVEMTPGTFKSFDEAYCYTLITKRRGHLQSGAALLDDRQTRAHVKLQATAHGSTFFKDFAACTVKLSKVGVSQERLVKLGDIVL